jgi:SAM-dependent methyltransferase
MTTDNPIAFWNKVSDYGNWREYILPKRTDQEFEDEGKEEANNISRFIKEDYTVLDYGCGIGRVLKYVKAKRKIGLDISEKYLEIANNDKTSEYYLVDKFNEQVDFIYSLSVLQHNNEIERDKIIKSIVCLLKDGGRALISFAHIKSPNYIETEFVHKFTKKEVEEYGKHFTEYEIIEGNLVNYKDGKKCDYNEYFLIGIK